MMARWHHEHTRTGDPAVDLSLALEESRKANGRDDRSRSPPGEGELAPSPTASMDNALKRNSESGTVTQTPAKKAALTRQLGSSEPMVGPRGRVREAADEIENRAGSSAPMPRSPRTISRETREKSRNSAVLSPSKVVRSTPADFPAPPPVLTAVPGNTPQPAESGEPASEPTEDQIALQLALAESAQDSPSTPTNSEVASPEPASEQTEDQIALQLALAESAQEEQDRAQAQLALVRITNWVEWLKDDRALRGNRGQRSDGKAPSLGLTASAEPPLPIPKHPTEVVLWHVRKIGSK